MKKLLIVGLILSTTLLFFSCKKEAGIGGKTTITGNIMTNYYCTENGELKSVSGANGQRVYISYGGENLYNDNVRAGKNGEFEFQFLHPGKYRISVLSECRNCETGMVEISKSIELGKKEKSVSIGELKINSYSKDFCNGPGAGGSATANGNLTAFFINGNNNDTLGTGALYNQRVYLVYGEGSTQSDNVRSSADGSYQFTRLRPGKYRVFAYSDCNFCLNQIEAVFTSFEVKENETEITIPELKVVIIK